jgi:hypothetical protein
MAVPTGVRRVELDSPDPVGAACELTRERASACSEIQDEIAGADSGIRDDRGCERPTAEEVPAVRAREPTSASRDAGHGRPPSSSRPCV